MTTPAEAAAAALRKASYMVILAGAGMSADSGIPTYRDEGGFWRGHPLLEQLGIKDENSVSPKLLESNPEAFWRLMRGKKDLIAKAEPHLGHRLISTWIKNLNLPCFIVTSNVDSMFQRAGFPESRIWEVHGSLGYLQCCTPCKNEVWAYDSRSERLPRCRFCGKSARPAVLLFNDLEWANIRSSRQLAEYDQFCREYRHYQGVALEIGAGEKVAKIRYLAEELEESGSTLVRINPGATEAASAITLRQPAVSAITEIDAALRC